MYQVPAGTKEPPPAWVAWPPSRSDRRSAAHPQKHQKPPKYHFLRFETAPHNHPTHRRQPLGGRARHSVRAAIGIPADKLSPTAAIPMLHLRNTLCKCLFLQHVTFAAKAPKMRVASPLASLSPQRGEGLRVRGGHTQSCLPSGFFLYQPHPGSRLNTEHFLQKPPK